MPDPRHPVERELGDIADVDRLNAPAGITGREDPPALRCTTQPPGQPAHVLPGLSSAPSRSRLVLASPKASVTARSVPAFRLP
ncbi:hypothetical protein [Kitasatospora sp. NPDC056181]|uniref:hypothetical protein n=1 Tax=Kitasatospora sp. NPDC056181 TaxID=3345737 RepID=UPI0035DB9BB1